MEKTCETCRHYLGGGCCNRSLERECRDGGFEGWEEVTAHLFRACLLCLEDREMTHDEMIAHVAITVPLPSLLMGLAEECAELQQGLHKMERALRGENPTTVTPETSAQWIAEELGDVMLYAEILRRLGLHEDGGTEKKLERWAARLNGDMSE